VKRIISAALIILVSVGSAIVMMLAPAMPIQPSLPRVPTVSPIATATPAIGPCPWPNGRWPYVYPPPSVETDFVSAPDPANDNQPYTGGITYTLAYSGDTFGVFIRNTGTRAIPIKIADFDEVWEVQQGLGRPRFWAHDWPTSVQPGIQVRLEMTLRVGGDPLRTLVWHIGGQFGTITTPFREPDWPLFAPVQIGCG
jgi:hypothetical protein